MERTIAPHDGISERVMIHDPLAVFAAGAMPAAILSAVRIVSTFGEPIAPVSDTTIASSGTRQMEIGGTVRRWFKYAVPAKLVVLMASQHDLGVFRVFASPDRQFAKPMLT